MRSGRLSPISSRKKETRLELALDSCFWRNLEPVCDRASLTMLPWRISSYCCLFCVDSNCFITWNRKVSDWFIMEPEKQFWESTLPPSDLPSDWVGVLATVFE